MLWLLHLRHLLVLERFLKDEGDHPKTPLGSLFGILHTV